MAVRRTGAGAGRPTGRRLTGARAVIRRRGNLLRRRDAHVGRVLHKRGLRWLVCFRLGNPPAQHDHADAGDHSERDPQLARESPSVKVHNPRLMKKPPQRDNPHRNVTFALLRRA